MLLLFIPNRFEAVLLDRSLLRFLIREIDHNKWVALGACQHRVVRLRDVVGVDNPHYKLSFVSSAVYNLLEVLGKCGEIFVRTARILKNMNLMS